MSILLSVIFFIFQGLILLLVAETSEQHKNENGTQKSVHIFKSNARTLLKLGVGLDHMYTKGWIF